MSVTLQLTLTVKVDFIEGNNVNDTIDELKINLKEFADEVAGGGLLSDDTDAFVDSWQAHVEVLEV